ncbi:MULTISPECIES: nucleoside diphosphate kinase regulator [Dyadobacter]|uniref:Regulator of nucleoside diphosphate kinase n=1 Tax=Dyadobacter psychrophilus TaxID=651661 RepID=A0A1T5B6H3_9BACT|nr:MULTISPECIES: nucleoside diphosphate kinase regulator [Dyadobacter]MCF2487738.1 nucleoside diphosphate kinase regulator [Dyadobacter sp. CY347]SKB42755.1 regulator of nucleoside diphosphate kinase [Dyadobacter psychrophilus]
MKNQKNTVILSEDDFRMLKQFAENFPTNPNEMTLSYELNRAIVVENDQLPEDSVRLNSQVRVKELASNREMEFCIVMPAQADIKQKKISVLTPMGAALIGLCKGETIEWKMPAGMKKFEVIEVTQIVM